MTKNPSLKIMYIEWKLAILILVGNWKWWVLFAILVNNDYKIILCLTPLFKSNQSIIEESVLMLNGELKCTIIL